MNAFRSKGYEGTSVQDLVDATGVGRGSLYAAFGSKEGLYLAAMDRWILHLTERHAGAEAPCLVYLPQAQQRLQERREGFQPS